MDKTPDSKDLSLASQIPIILNMKWFILDQETVTGPFTTDEVEAQVDQGTLSGSTLIWGKIMLQWQDISSWKAHLDGLLEKMKPGGTKQIWHYALDNVTHGPYSFTQLIEHIKSLDIINDLLVWKPGMETWASIFDFHEIIKEIGLIAARAHPRTHIKGKAIFSLDNNIQHNGIQHVAPLTSISIGGCGMSTTQNLEVGQIITIELKSDDLFLPIHTKAEVRYIDKINGSTGLKFQQLHSEARSAIMGYMQRDKSQAKAAA